MKNYNVLFCDLDGTIIKTMTGETFPKGVWDMELRFDVLDAIKKLAPDFVYIVSNQGGIEKGFVDREDFYYKISYVVSCIKEYCGIEHVSSNYCDTNDKNDPWRKPNTRQLEMFDYNYKEHRKFDKTIDLMLMIGDASGKEGQFSDTDKKTAENFDIDYMDVEDFVTELNDNTETERKEG